MNIRVQAKAGHLSSTSLTSEKQRYEWNEGQRNALDVLSGDQTHTLIFGGGRSGKTFLFIKLIIQRALRAKNSRHLAARFRGNAVRASVWLDTFPKVIRTCFPGLKHQSHRQDGFEEFPNGSQLWFGGLDDKDRAEKILGQEYATIYPGECSQIPYHSILILRTRLAQVAGIKLRGFYDLNPVGQAHWSYREFVQKLDPITRLKLVDPDDYDYCTINPNQNIQNLDPSYLRYLQTLPGNYKIRFWKGMYVVEVEGALWTSELLELCRDEEYAPGGVEHKKLSRVAIGVDPSGSSGKADLLKNSSGQKYLKSDQIGIVAAGTTWDKRGVILEDVSCSGSPKQWGTAVVAAFKRWKANIVVAEGNFGGEMVRSTIQSVDANVPVKLVHASRGKHIRAEPISALYEDKRVEHAGRFITLEDQLCQFSNTGYMGDTSPDNADAAIWALTELMLGEHTDGLLGYYKELAEKAKEEQRKGR